VAFGQSVYSRDIVEGVIQKLTTVMVELLKSGQPVKWDGLGTFTPNIQSRGVSQIKNVSVDQIQGVHINFIPENAKGEELTSKKFKDLCVFEVLGYLVSTNIGTQQKPKYQRVLYPVDYQASGSGNNGGGTQSGGSQSGGSSQSATLAAPTISGTTPFAETTSVSMSGPAGAEIRYTTDGNTPTAESTLYSEAFTLSDTATVKAIAIKGGQSSEMASKTFTKEGGAPPAGDDDNEVPGEG
jgi:predicted histone-like DNA-binding protein